MSIMRRIARRIIRAAVAVPIALAALPGAASGEGAGDADFTLPPPAAFRPVVERPLFDPGRRGRDTGAASGPVAPGPDAGSSDSRLLGVIIAGPVARAVLRVAGRDQVLEIGGRVEGWRLTAVDHTGIGLAPPAEEAAPGVSTGPGAAGPGPVRVAVGQALPFAGAPLVPSAGLPPAPQPTPAEPAPAPGLLEGVPED